MFASNPLLPGGFCTVTNAVCKYLTERGHDLFVVSPRYSGLPISMPNYTLMPLNRTQDLADSIDHVQPGLVIVYGHYQFFEMYKRARSFKYSGPILGYIILDTPPVHDMWASLFGFDFLITPSEYSGKILADHGLPATVVPHGVDLELFKPDGREKKEIVFGCVSANSFRKFIPRLFEAYAIMKHRKECKLNLCTPPAPGREGFPLEDFRRYYGISESERRYPSRLETSIGISPEGMPGVYNTFTCHVLPTSGESFGIPFVEAMACGVPSITTDVGAAREVLGECGFYVATNGYLDHEYGRLHLIDVPELSKTMDMFFEVHASNPKQYSEDQERCVERAKKFEWNRSLSKLGEIVDQWK